MKTEKLEKRGNLTVNYLNIPQELVIAESENSALLKCNFILTYADVTFFWVAKKHLKFNKLNEFAPVLQITIFSEWDYQLVNIDGNHEEVINGADLINAILGTYPEYNYQYLAKNNLKNS